jgi:hypothetical protein
MTDDNEVTICSSGSENEGHMDSGSTSVMCSG